MIIHYCTSDSFYDGILELTKRGLHFEANHDNLTITLTGGY